MQTADRQPYDAVIIGAGIGGLVCGCYLAKAGMKVLIAERHHSPGGYCSSFRRKGVTFDAAAHCFGAYRENGVTRKILRELGADRLVEIERFNPSDTVTTPDCRISYWSSIDATTEEFLRAFPRESDNIRKFLQFQLNPDPNAFAKIRSWTMKKLLDTYFTDEKLKFMIAAPLLGNGGLPPSLMSAFIGSKLFSEFLLDGGYHPRGGMQSLPDALARKFQEFGGTLRLSCEVKKIKTKNRKVIGVVLDKGGFVPSACVVSNGDARMTLFTLLGKDKLEKDFCHTISAMMPSSSNFVAYLVTDGSCEPLPKPGTSTWFFSQYDLDLAYQAIPRGDLRAFGGYMFRVSPGQDAMSAYAPAPYKSEHYWKKHKSDFLDALIGQIQEHSVPDLSSHVTYAEAASPFTLYRYTLNYRGSSYGWAGIPSQLAVAGLKKISSVRGLYLAGHWTTQGLGISGAAYVGSDTARMILRQNAGVRLGR